MQTDGTESLYAVKTAGFRDAMALYGAKGLDAAKRVGTSLFSHHPLPVWSPAAQGFTDKGRDWGRIGDLLYSAEKKLFRNVNPINTGEHTPVYFGPGNRWTDQESGYGPGVWQLKGRIADAARQSGIGPAARLAAHGAGNTLKGVGHEFADVARDTVFGSPIDLHRQLGAGDSLAANTGRYLKDFYVGQRGINPLHAAMSLGFPAMQLYQGLSHGGREHRGEVIGANAASLLASPFTFRLGIPGGLLQGAASSVGGRLGALFDPKTANPSAVTYPHV